MQLDFLFIERLKIPVRIGTTDEERAFPQIIFLSIEIETSLERSGLSDDIADTVDYAAVTAEVENFVKSREFTLVEALAEAAARIVLNRPLVTATRIRVEKKVLPQVESVGVQICREKNR